MNEVEAIKIIEIMLTADMGCSDCAGGLLAQFNELFPQFKCFADSMYREKFPEIEKPSPVQVIINSINDKISISTLGGGGSKNEST